MRFQRQKILKFESTEKPFRVVNEVFLNNYEGFVFYLKHEVWLSIKKWCEDQRKANLHKILNFGKENIWRCKNACSQKGVSFMQETSINSLKKWRSKYDFIVRNIKNLPHEYAESFHSKVTNNLCCKLGRRLSTKTLERTNKKLT